MTEAAPKTTLPPVQQALKKLPGVDHLLEIAGKEPELSDAPRKLLTDSAGQCWTASEK
ncbi:MAG: hypothetical protein R2860_07185 [Desulfobacterales bacterium]